MWLIRTAIIAGSITSIVGVVQMMKHMSGGGSPFFIPSVVVIGAFLLTCFVALRPASSSLREGVTFLLAICTPFFGFVILGTWSPFAIVALVTCVLWFGFQMETKSRRSTREL